MNNIKISAASKRRIPKSKLAFNYHVSSDKNLIIYIPQGKGKLILNEAEHRILGGDFLFFKSGDAFSLRFAQNLDALVYFLEFEKDGFTEFEKTLSLSSLYHFKNSNEINTLFEGIARSFIRKPPFWEMICSALLCQLLCCVSSSQKDNNHVTSQIDALFYDIHENFLSDDVDVEKYAQRAGLSKDRFSVIFKESFGYPPYKYQLMLKMKEATYLLTHTDLAIYEISEILGFSTPLYFSSAYKKQMGISPTDARKSDN